jgi:hypothetical protein
VATIPAFVLEVAALVAVGLETGHSVLPTLSAAMDAAARSTPMMARPSARLCRVASMPTFALGQEEEARVVGPHHCTADLEVEPSTMM